MKEGIYGGAEKKKAGRMRCILLRGAVTAAFFACVLFIWHNSWESAEVSAGRSGRATGIVNRVFAFLGQEPVTEHFVRKLAHFSEYGLESVLTVLLFLAYGFHAGKWRWKIVLTGLVTAVIDESIQFFSAGRAPGFPDVCIDMAGFVCGMAVMFAAYMIFWKCCRQRLSRK